MSPLSKQDLEVKKNSVDVTNEALAPLGALLPLWRLSNRVYNGGLNNNHYSLGQ